MQEEIWKVYNRNYYNHHLVEVSNYGNVRIDGKLKKFNLSPKQLYYNFCGMYLHRIIAELFIPNPENKPEIDHIDTNKLNNRVDNLRWVTRKENLNNKQTLINYSKVRKGVPKNDRVKRLLSNQMKGRKWMSDSNNTVFVKSEYFDYYLEKGYHFGMK